MNRLSPPMLAGLLVVTTFVVISGIGNLPEQLAIHFATNGVADRWTTRENYRLFILLSLVGAPLLLVWLMAGLPRLTNGRGQIPNCEYWFAPERRETTLQFLMSHACWLGCITVAVIYGIHVSIVRANAITPPVLATDRLSFMVVVYLCGLVWWLATFMRHFQRKTAQTR